MGVFIAFAELYHTFFIFSWFWNSIKNESFYLQNKPLTWETVSGLNRITESSAKELLLAQVSEKPLEDVEKSAENVTSIEGKKTKIRESEILKKLRSILVKEILLKRWVPSNQELVKWKFTTTSDNSVMCVI